MEEIAGARSILRQSDVTYSMKEKNPNRYLKLEDIVLKANPGKDVSI